MVFSNFSIRIKMISLISIAAGLVFVGGLVGILKFNSVIDEYRILLGVEKQHQVDLIQVQSHFKSMVQDWKNVLIRGANKEQRDKYWSRFQKTADGLTKHLKMNLEIYRELAADDLHWNGANVVGDMEKLIPAWEAAIAGYRNGYAEYEASGFITQAGDSAVTGINQVPEELLVKIAAEINGIVTSADESVAADAAAGSTSVLGIMLISLIGSVFLASVVIQRVAIRPLKALEVDIERLTSGDFSREIKVTTGDELGALAKGAQSLQEQLGHIIRNITEATGHLADASTSMQKTSQEAAEAVDRQKHQTEQAATAMNEMSATSHEVARNAGNGAAAAKDADEQSKQGNMVVDQTIQTINELASEMKRAVDVIQELSQNSESIGGILDVIRGIADQTNLLALNAAIEAARAGEQGRGFAVVADEVRTLAKRTQDSTEEIQTMIEQLQHGTREAVTVMDSGYQKTELCVSQAAKAGDALAAIAEAVTVISDMNDQIASAAEEQTAVAEEINTNVTNIAGITEQTVQLVGRTTAASEEVDLNTERLRGLVSGLKI